jgi:uncharacterized membrane protein
LFLNLCRPFKRPDWNGLCIVHKSHPFYTSSLYHFYFPLNLNYLHGKVYAYILWSSLLWVFSVLLLFSFPYALQNLVLKHF